MSALNFRSQITIDRQRFQLKSNIYSKNLINEISSKSIFQFTALLPPHNIWSEWNSNFKHENN